MMNNFKDKKLFATFILCVCACALAPAISTVHARRCSRPKAKFACFHLDYNLVDVYNLESKGTPTLSGRGRVDGTGAISDFCPYIEINSSSAPENLSGTQVNREETDTEVFETLQDDVINCIPNPDDLNLDIILSSLINPMTGTCPNFNEIPPFIQRPQNVKFNDISLILPDQSETAGNCQNSNSDLSDVCSLLNH